ncbi:unnamed protein product, partial [Heterotrigona itama]
ALDLFVINLAFNSSRNSNQGYRQTSKNSWEHAVPLDDSVIYRKGRSWGKVGCTKGLMRTLGVTETRNRPQFICVTGLESGLSGSNFTLHAAIYTR